jgi:hypothetical protein
MYETRTRGDLTPIFVRQRAQGSTTGIEPNSDTPIISPRFRVHDANPYVLLVWIYLCGFLQRELKLLLPSPPYTIGYKTFSSSCIYLFNYPNLQPFAMMLRATFYSIRGYHMGLLHACNLC